jgi:hypothetical protein
VADGALLGVNGLLHGGAEKLHIAAKVPGPLTPRAMAPTLKWERSARAQAAASGSSAKASASSSSPVACFSVVTCSAEQGREMRVGQHRGDGRLQICCQSGQSSLKTWVHGVAS